MQNNKDLFDNIRFILDTTGRGTATPKECARALSLAQTDLYLYYAHDCEGEQGLKGYGASDRATDALQPFYKAVALTFPPNSPAAPTPADMGVFLELYSDAGKECIEYLPNQWGTAKGSAIYAAEQKVLLTGTTIQTHPTKPTSRDFQIHYLKKPLDVLFLATTTGRAIDISTTTTAGTSQPPQFATTEWGELVKRALVYLGLSLSDADSYTYGFMASGMTPGKQP